MERKLWCPECKKFVVAKRDEGMLPSWLRLNKGPYVCMKCGSKVLYRKPSNHYIFGKEY